MELNYEEITKEQFEITAAVLRAYRQALEDFSDATDEELNGISSLYTHFDCEVLAKEGQ